MKRISVRLNVELYRRLKALAKIHQLTVSQMVRMLISDKSRFPVIPTGGNEHQ